MHESNVMYCGNVRIYLEGINALMPVKTQLEGQMNYFVGTSASSIQIKDYRQAPIQAARLVLKGCQNIEFADIFNQPAWAEVREGEEGIDIHLQEGSADENDPVLWLGVIHNGLMPIREIDWEVLKPVSPTEIAFAALVRDETIY